MASKRKTKGSVVENLTSPKKKKPVKPCESRVTRGSVIRNSSSNVRKKRLSARTKQALVRIEEGKEKVAFRSSRQSSKFNVLKLFEKLRCSNIDFIKWLKELGLLGEEYECPECASNMRLVPSTTFKSDGYEWLCEGAEESHIHTFRSIRKGTWFEMSKLTLSEIMLITYGWVSEWSTECILHEVGMLASDSAVIDEWKGFCRDVCLDAMLYESDKIGGKGCVVEIIDECEFEKCEGKHVGEQKWAYCGVEHKGDGCFIMAVYEKSKEVLLDVVKMRILPGTTVISQLWEVYDCQDDEDYVELSDCYTFKSIGAGTSRSNPFNSMWPTIKRNIPSRCKGVCDGYLGEYMWRKRLDDSKDVFYEFLEAVKKFYIPCDCDE